jgi:very-short-patch-repair endonuclease
MIKTHQYLSNNLKTFSRNMRKESTKEEIILWQSLRKKQLGYRFRRQFVMDNKYIIDFICLDKKLIIELDGSQHCENKKDKTRNSYLQSQGFVVLRLWNNEILKNLDGCLEKINDCLNNL